MAQPQFPSGPIGNRPGSTFPSGVPTSNGYGGDPKRQGLNITYEDQCNQNEEEEDCPYPDFPPGLYPNLSSQNMNNMYPRAPPQFPSDPYGRQLTMNPMLTIQVPPLSTQCQQPAQQNICFPLPQSAPEPQQDCENDSSLIGFRAVKLVRKICRSPCSQRKVCKPCCPKPNCCVVAKCKPKRCAPQNPCQQQPCPTCNNNCPPPPPPCCRTKVKCQYRLVSQPRRMFICGQSENTQNSSDPPMVLVREMVGSNKSEPQGRGQEFNNPVNNFSNPVNNFNNPVNNFKPLPRYAEAYTVTDCTVASQCDPWPAPDPQIAVMAAAPVQQQQQPCPQQQAMDSNYYWPSWYGAYGGYGMGGGYNANYGGGYGMDPGCDDDFDRGRSRSCDNCDRCDSCESFERWRLRCECKKKLREECERKLKDGGNDPKPSDAGSGKGGKNVSVNTSDTKANKSKSASSVKSKGKKSKGKKKGKKKK